MKKNGDGDLLFKIIFCNSVTIRRNTRKISPGVIVKLHQKYPTFVIECEGMSIARDEKVAENIRVWSQEVEFAPRSEPEGGGLFRGFGFRRRRRGRGPRGKGTQTGMT